MRTATQVLAPTVVATLLLAGAAAAQDTAVVRTVHDARRATLAALPAGTFVRMIDDAAARPAWVQGHLLRVADDTLHLRDGWRGTPVAVPLGRVTRAEMRGKGERTVGIVTGTLVGVVFGVATTALENRRGVLVAGAVVNGLLGGAIGALATRERWVALWPAGAVSTR
jgi:hypothetical protein